MVYGDRASVPFRNSLTMIIASKGFDGVFCVIAVDKPTTCAAETQTPS